MNAMINITINGAGHHVVNNINLAEVLALYPPKSTFACALNGEFIGKEQYQTTLLKQSDNIDVLVPIVGG